MLHLHYEAAWPSESIPECLFEQEPTKNTLKNILSQISVNNDEISWDPRKFEGD